MSRFFYPTYFWWVSSSHPRPLSYCGGMDNEPPLNSQRTNHENEREIFWEHLREDTKLFCIVSKVKFISAMTVQARHKYV